MLTSLRPDYNALIVGSSGGIGSALVTELSSDARCSLLVELSRSTQPQIDYDHPEAIADVASEIRGLHGEIDVLIVATGILTTPTGEQPEKAFSQLKAQSLTALMQANAIGPAMVLKYFMPLMPRSRRCLIATLSARVGSIGDNNLGGWISYRASKSALNQITRTAAIELRRKNQDAVCVALHPGTIPTDLSEPYARDQFTHSTKACAINMLTVLNTLTPEQTGGFYDYTGAEIIW